MTRISHVTLPGHVLTFLGHMSDVALMVTGADLETMPGRLLLPLPLARFLLDRLPARWL